jgi:hypothetical protein
MVVLSGSDSLNGIQNKWTWTTRKSYKKAPVVFEFQNGRKLATSGGWLLVETDHIWLYSSQWEMILLTVNQKHFDVVYFFFSLYSIYKVTMYVADMIEPLSNYNRPNILQWFTLAFYPKTFTNLRLTQNDSGISLVNQAILIDFNI